LQRSVQIGETTANQCINRRAPITSSANFNYLPRDARSLSYTAVGRERLPTGRAQGVAAQLGSADARAAMADDTVPFPPQESSPFAFQLLPTPPEVITISLRINVNAVASDVVVFGGAGAAV